MGLAGICLVEVVVVVVVVVVGVCDNGVRDSLPG